ncbi:MAG: hypothetical protein BroJett029_26090 [Alphaproteobacteria bacterium]|nr:MAG: hypothetical protein BroJett029_26090 [Alphaproteobacteria bacterium]
MIAPAAGRLRKRSVTIAGHRTSLSLEAEFWEALKELAAAEGVSLNRLIEEIDRARQHGGAPPPNLSSAARVYVLERLRERGRYEGKDMPPAR